MPSPPDLRTRIGLLEEELPPVSTRFRIHEALPYAVFRYEPDQEWELRREVNLLRTRLEQKGVDARIISLADLLWEAVDTIEGIDAIVDLEREYGFEAAQDQVHTYLSDEDFAPLPAALAERLNAMDSDRGLGLIVRAASLAPEIFPVSQLLERMQGLSRTPAVLFYPGTLEGTNRLRFMGLPDRETFGSYRVKIYA